MSAAGSLHLWVLRHAKAAAQGPGGDATRPLTGRGRRQAERVRAHLESLGTDYSLPSLCISSPAVRARQTAELVMPALPRARLEFDEALYSKDADGLVDWLRMIDPEESSVMVVGHNPTFLELCVMLAGDPEGEELESEGLPTAGLVVLEQRDAIAWTELAPHGSRVVSRFAPGKD